MDVCLLLNIKRTLLWYRQIPYGCLMRLAARSLFWRLLFSLLQLQRKTYPYVRYYRVDMKRVPLFPHLKVLAGSQKYPPFSVFLGTSMGNQYDKELGGREHLPIVGCDPVKSNLVSREWASEWGRYDTRKACVRREGIITNKEDPSTRTFWQRGWGVM